MMEKQYLTRVLVVEDNQVDSLVLQEMLRRFGCAVQVAHGLDVTEKLDQRYDVIFLDIHMPGINGFNIATSVKSAAMQDQRPAIILVSSNPYDATMHAKCLDASVDGYVQKPVKEEVLAEVLERCVPHCAITLLMEGETQKGFLRDVIKQA